MENNKEQFSEGLAELLILTFNSYSKYPLHFLYSHEESGSAHVENKLTTSGQGLKNKLKKEIQLFIENNDYLSKEEKLENILLQVSSDLAKLQNSYDISSSGDKPEIVEFYNEMCRNVTDFEDLSK